MAGIKTRTTPSTPSTPNVPISSDALERYPDKELEGEIKKYKFNPTTLFQIQIGIASSGVEEETIVGDLLSNRSFRLNSTGARIWQELQSGEKTFLEIAQKVQKEYQLDANSSEESVVSFLHELIALGLIVASTDGEQKLQVESQNS